MFFYIKKNTSPKIQLKIVDKTLHQIKRLSVVLVHVTKLAWVSTK